MSDKVYVWDRIVRVFHWTLVALFATSYLTGENEHWLHVYSGYGIVLLVVVRIVWGLIGSQHARFRDFVFSPTNIWQYTKSVIAKHPKRYLGHNPLGGLMVVTMLVALSLTTLSGMKLYAVEEGKGPFAVIDSVNVVTAAQADSPYENRNALYKENINKEDEELWEELHEFGVNLMIALIIFTTNL